MQSQWGTLAHSSLEDVSGLSPGTAQMHRCSGNDRLDRSVAGKGAGAYGVPGLPQQDLTPVVARGEGLAIRRESNGIDPVRMSQKGVELLPGDRVPEPHFFIVACRGNGFEIR